MKSSIEGKVVLVTGGTGSFGQKFIRTALDELNPKKIIVFSRSKSEIKFVDYQAAYGEGFEDMTRRTPDIRKLKKTIRFVPEYNLDKLLKEIIQHHRKE